MQQHTQEEVWLPVVGYEGRYEVSNLGRVRSLDRVVIRGNNIHQPMRGRILKPWGKGGEGDRAHQVVTLGHYDRHYVHTLVLEAFTGPRPDGHEGCHNDGNPLNNRADNLRWDTASANQRDRLTHGTHHYARRTHCKHGHEYTPENTRWRIRKGPRNVTPSHARECLTCVRATGRATAQRRRQAAKNAAA